MLLSLLRRESRRLALAIAAILFLIEDLLIRRLGRALGRLIAHTAIVRLEAQIARLPRYPALAVFALPGILLLPINLLAAWLFTCHHAGLGTVALIFEKLFATAVVGRLLVLTRPALLGFAWFARADRWVTLTRDRIYGAMQSSAAWRAYLSLKARLADIHFLRHLGALRAVHRGKDYSSPQP